MQDTVGGLRQRAIMLMGAGVLIASLTGWSAYRVISSYQTELVSARQPREQMTVLAAVRDLPAGELVTAKDVVPLVMPADASLLELLFVDTKEVVGQVLRSPVLAGEPFRRRRFSVDLTEVALSVAILPGMRAVTVEVTRAAGVGGKLERGDHVDVMVTIRPEENALSADWVTGTILQGVRVLDTGDTAVDTVGDGKKAKVTAPAAPAPRSAWITLELEPKEAEKLAMASARGELHVALRGRSDFDIVGTTGPLLTNTLVGLGGPPSPERVRRLGVEKAAVAPEAGRTAEVIQGSSSIRESFDANGQHVELAPRGR